MLVIGPSSPDQIHMARHVSPVSCMDLGLPLMDLTLIFFGSLCGISSHTSQTSGSWKLGLEY